MSAAIPHTRGGYSMVIGLGNPMGMYETRSRHNAGFMTIDELSLEHDVELAPAPGDVLAMIARYTSTSGDEVLLVEPQTTMNRSGEAVTDLLKVDDVDRVVLVHDDVDMAPGRLRIRRRGRDGGHRGVRSVLAALGGLEPIRVKIGVGRPGDGTDMFDWVTGRIDDGDFPVIEQSTHRAAMAVDKITNGEDLDKVMSLMND